MIVSDADHGAFTSSNVYVAQMASKYALHASNSTTLELYRRPYNEITQRAALEES